jgi:hypothetical protein
MKAFARRCTGKKGPQKSKQKQEKDKRLLFLKLSVSRVRRNVL